MKVRYQRDLYRVQLCCDTEKEEKELGYPLQMCLRNRIAGLLACQVQGNDNRLTICWDVTSQHSLAQVTGEGQIAPAVLQRILQSLSQTMEAMARYLIPCEYLVLDPGLLFLMPESGAVGFVCDFEDPQSFQRTLLLLGEYVLEHMDHREQAAMHLGYGLYRLAVEESFDKEGMRRLCTEMDLQGKTKKENTMWNRPEQKEVLSQNVGLTDGWQNKNPEEISGNSTGYVSGKQVLHERQREAAMRDQADALQAFFAEDEEEVKLQISPWQICAGCAVAILFVTVLMEGVQYFRNGRHLQPVWLLVAGALFLLSGMAMLILWKLSGWKGKKTNETGTKEKAAMKKSARPQKNAEKQDGTAAYRYENAIPEPHGAYYKAMEKDYREAPERRKNCPSPVQMVSGYAGDYQPQSMETVVLNRSMPETTDAQLDFADGKTVPLYGHQWLLGKSPTGTDICLSQPTVSRIHARIWKKEETYYIEDLHSRNGTMVDGQLLEPGEKRRLEPGMEISFAEQMCTFMIKQGSGKMNCGYKVQCDGR